MAFEKFIKTHTRISSSPKVTMLKSGGLSFNSGAIVKFKK